jgi:hypothetical protein
MPVDNRSFKSSRTVQRKKDLKEDLLNRDLQSIEKRAEEEKSVLRSLSSLLYDNDPLIRWRAIESLAKISGIIAKKDSEKIRRQLRRILWLMNDESGGLCWNGPEAIGEIIYHIPAFIPEYASILISYLNEEPFEAGVRRAIARVAEVNRVVFADAIESIVKSLDSGDTEIRAFSIKALNSLQDTSAFKQVKSLNEDMSEVTDYDFRTGQLRNTTVRDFALAYLNRPVIVDSK